MTETREPVVSVDKRKAPEPETRTGVAAFLGVLIFAVTAVNLAASVYAFRAVNSLREIEGRLERLSEFEARVTSKLESMNNGLQAQFDLQNSSLQGQFETIRTLGGGGESVGPVSDEIDQLVKSSALGTMLSRDTALADSIVDEGAAQKNIVDAEIATPPARKPAPKPAGKTASYERYEGADGKVYYKKVQ